MLSVGGKCQAGPNVYLEQLRKIIKNLLIGHAGCEPPQHIINTDSGALNAWLAKTNVGIYCDVLRVIHCAKVRVFRSNIKLLDRKKDGERQRRAAACYTFHFLHFVSVLDVFENPKPLEGGLSKLFFKSVPY